MEKVKILSVGIGGFANIYLEHLLGQEEKNFEIVGMIDPFPQGAKFYGQLQEMGVPMYESMEAFYAVDSADLAVITTPIHLHTPQILCALNHGSNVMCEKPMSGVSADEALIREAIERTGKFVIIGFQWSYSQAILDLKQDVMDGVYGKATMLKSLVFWPRPKEYFTRGSGWGGRITINGDTIINDSVVSNATAHYLHNMLYVTGPAHGKSNEVAALECDLIRTNAIENFDTATLRLTLADGTPGIYVVSHSTDEHINPTFEYRFEKGVVTYSEADGQIIGKFNDGTVKYYGDPFFNINRKIDEAIRNAKGSGYEPPCGVIAAAAQVRCVETIQKNTIHPVKPEKIHEKQVDTNHYLYVEGLDELLKKCYQEEKIMSDYPEFKEMVD